MRVKPFVLPVSILFVAAFFYLGGADEVKHKYVGEKQCKICHTKSGIYDSWLTSKHAKAWEGLSEENKKNEEFKKFYTTGVNEKGELLTGVQCEACHGPGSDFKKKSVMENRELAISNGLVIPDEKTCRRCHNEKAPAALAATARDFNFEKMKARGVHTIPAKSAK